MQKGNLKRTPVFEEHVRMGGHMVDFAGWEMPLHYGSIIEEHMAVRQSAGLFDVSHMGELLFTGRNASSALDRLSTNGLANTQADVCTYTHHLGAEGRIIDDTIATRISDQEFMTVPNASMTGVVYSWVKANADCSVADVSDDVCCLALQGPSASRIIEIVAPGAVELKGFRGMFTGKGRGDFMERLERGDFYVTRTGYTGEDGFELFVHRKNGAETWKRLLEEGRQFGIRPVGLGARDSLRLEKCYLLSGTDFDGRQTTLETGYNWIINWDHEFMGKDALERQKGEGDYARLASILIEGRAIPRHGDTLTGAGGSGHVTSGGYSPVLGKAIAMGYLKPWAKAGDRVNVTVRGRAVEGTVVKPPFVRASR